MNNKNIEIDYDLVGDSRPAYYNEIEDDLFEGVDKKTGKLVGYKIFNLSKRKKQEWMKKVKISLPANVDINS